jgi:hypothetical protein
VRAQYKDLSAIQKDLALTYKEKVQLTEQAKRELEASYQQQVERVEQATREANQQQSELREKSKEWDQRIGQVLANAYRHRAAVAEMQVLLREMAMVALAERMLTFAAALGEATADQVRTAMATTQAVRGMIEDLSLQLEASVAQAPEDMLRPFRGGPDILARLPELKGRLDTIWRDFAPDKLAAERARRGAVTPPLPPLDEA